MNFGDILGLLVIISVFAAGIFGLLKISRPVSYSKDEYEERLRRSSGIARGAMNSLMYPLAELIHPRAVEAVHVIRDLKAGHYNAIQADGDTSDLGLTEERSHTPGFRGSGRKRPIGLIRLFINLLRGRK